MSTPMLAPLGRPHSWHFLGPNRGKRYACGLRATCQPVAAWMDRDFIWPATITDLSTGGVGIVLGRRFEPGVGLAVELAATADRSEETLLVRVMQVTAIPGGYWMLGCAFLSELSEDTVLALVNQRNDLPTCTAETANPGAGPASSVGRKAGLETVVANVRFCVWLCDGRSLWFTAKRVFPRLAWPLAVGEKLVLNVGGESLRVLSHHCAQEAGRWIVYCEHTDEELNLPAILQPATRLGGN